MEDPNDLYNPSPLLPPFDEESHESNATPDRPKKRSRISPLSSSPDNEKPDHEWLEGLYAFLLFRSINGSDAIPNIRSNSAQERALSRWVTAQGNNMNLVQNGSADVVTQNKVQALLQTKDFPFNHFQERTNLQGSRFERNQENLALLREYMAQHGHCNVPYNDPILGRWVKYIKSLYNKGLLDQETQIAVEEIGLKWNHWDEMYSQLQSYKTKFGTISIPRKDSDDSWEYNPLSRWVENQRAKYKKHTFKPEQIVKLQEIGFEFNSHKYQQVQDQPLPFQQTTQQQQRIEKRNENLKLLREYKAHHGHCNVKQKEGKLGAWLNKVKYRYRAGTLDSELVVQLEEIGIDWSHWDRMYAVMKSFHESHGHCKVRKNQGEEYPSLYKWAQSQRRQFKEGILSDDRIEKLNHLGFVWVAKGNPLYVNAAPSKPTKRAPNPKTVVTHLEKRNINLNLLRAYKQQHGHCNVKASEGKLGRWVKKMRWIYQNGALDADLQAELEEIGLEWSYWDEMYEQLITFYQSHGHCNVPNGEVNKKLAQWTTTQRNNYKAGKISEERIEKLEEVGFVWNAVDIKKAKGGRVVVKSHSEKVKEHMEKLRALKEAKAAK